MLELAVQLLLGAVTIVGLHEAEPNKAPLPGRSAITISTLVPTYAIASGPDFTLFVNGVGFTRSAVVLWDGVAIPTKSATDAILTASVSSSLIRAPGTISVAVSDPSSGATSKVVPFGVASPAAATAGVIQLITVAPDGSAADGDSRTRPAISADGRFVAFQSAATNLVSGPASGFQDVYVRDTCLGAPLRCVPATTRVSVTHDGSPTNGGSRSPAMSADGRFVVFDSSATNILPGTTLCGSTACVFLRDTCNTAGVGCVPRTALISTALDGTTANGGSPSISATGRLVTFDSSSTNVVLADSNAAEDAFVSDTCFGASGSCIPRTTLISVSSAGVQAAADSHGDAISGNGRFVAFQSFASNLVPNQTDQPGMFVRDTCIGAPDPCKASIIRVDVGTKGERANGLLTFNVAPSISTDGRLVAFASLATNLACQSVDRWANVYVRDTCSGAPASCTPGTTLVSLANDGSVGNNGSSNQAMSADGRYIAFSSLSSNLVPGDTFVAGTFKDVFVRDTCFGAASGCVPSTVRVSVVNSPNPQTQADEISDNPAISADGHYLVFLSAATNLSHKTSNGHTMVFLAKTGF